MYCVRCGVELADSEQACPLCGTEVYHPQLERPDGKKPYPRDKMPELPARSLRLPGLLTVVVVLAGWIAALCNQQVNGSITWSGYVLGSLLVTYVALILPSWFRNPNPTIFVPCSFAAAIVFLLYINYATGGNWFLSFAFPVAGGIGLIATTLATLLHYLHRGRLFIIGGCCMGLGGFALLTEFLLNLTFSIPRFSGWSLYPMGIMLALGGWLIFLGICRPAREMMERRFFL